MERNIDLAAVAVPDLDMPTGYALTNGGYVASDCVRSAGSSVVPAVDAAFEATYEEHLGTGFLTIQVVAFSAGVDFPEDIYLNSIELGAFLHTICDKTKPFLAVRPGGDRPEFPACTSAIYVGRLVIRTVWSSSAWPETNAVEGIQAAVTHVNELAAGRAGQLLSGKPIPGVDFSLPGMVSRFRPEANFEHYVHRPDRYDRSDKPAGGFTAGYRRGYTEPWVERGTRRRLIACDVLRFNDADCSRTAIAHPEGLVSNWRMEHRFVPEDSRLHDCAMFAWQDAASFWSVVLFAAQDEYVITADVWGHSTLRKAETEASRIMHLIRQLYEDGGQMTVIEAGF